MTQRKVTASAPGKVLAVGGYLVLERPNLGVVVTCDVRMQATVEPLVGEECDSAIRVDSPQFGTSHLYQVSDSGKLENRSGPQNPFITKTLALILDAVRSIRGADSTDKFKAMLRPGIRVLIQGDNSFYSHRLKLVEEGKPVSMASLRDITRFSPVVMKDGNVMKTGLGSSAALVTSLVGALLAYFDVISATEALPKDLELVHTLAQACHCAAQGKIGSGFDVCSATYGSHVFVRFSPEMLDEVVADDVQMSSLKNVLDRRALDHSVKPFKLPPKLRLLFGDVCGGSNTPSLVSKVLQWKAEGGIAAEKLWNELGDHNVAVADVLHELNALATQSTSNYHEGLKLYFRDGSSTHPVSQLLKRLREEFISCRRCLKTIGEQSGADIEPDSQTALLDQTMQVSGVLLAGVPGAGGYDAIFAIVEDSCIAKVEELWQNYTASTVCALPVDAESSEQGLRIHSYS